MATIALAAAGVAALGSYLGGKGAKKQAKAQAQQSRKAKKQLSAANIIGATQAFQPQFRELIAGGEGPAFQQQVAANLASHGLTGTGVGEALRNASFGIPEIEAFRRALEMGYQVQKDRAGVILGSPPPAAVPNPFLGALTSGAAAYFGASQKQPAATQAPTAMGLSPFTNIPFTYTPKG